LTGTLLRLSRIPAGTAVLGFWWLVPPAPAAAQSGPQSAGLRLIESRELTPAGFPLVRALGVEGAPAVDGDVLGDPAYADAMQRYGAEASGMVWLDPSGTTMGTRLMLHEDQKLLEKPNPTVALKAVKNETEIAAARNSHRHAAAAKIRSFKRLQDSIMAGETVSAASCDEAGVTVTVPPGWDLRATV